MALDATASKEAIRDSFSSRWPIGEWYGEPHESNRRSIYLKQKRDKLPDQRVLFDSANGMFLFKKASVNFAATSVADEQRFYATGRQKIYDTGG